MKWNDFRRSKNVVDRRGQPAQGAAGRGRTVAAGGGLGLGGIILVILLSLFTGQNPLALLGLVNTPPGSTQTQTPGTQTPGTQTPGTQTLPPGTQDQGGDFVAAVLGDTEDVWHRLFREADMQYREPQLILFSQSIDSACGFATAASGPFYCPADSRVYLDLNFFSQLAATAGAEADFARAYVIAHEVGHHIQNQLGILRQVQTERSRLSTAESNLMQVRVELQADCYAGVWGHYTAQRGIIDGRDVDAALRAAAAVGDDTLQRQSRGRVVPETFTHGSAEQRTRWFTRGLETGDPAACDTFDTPNL